MSLPTEVVENIAIRLSRTCLLAFRRAHPRLAEDSSDAFAKKFLSDISWFIGHYTIEAQIRGLLARPHFASRVTRLRVEPVAVYCHSTCQEKPTYAQDLPIRECVALMTSLVGLKYGRDTDTTQLLYQPKIHAQLVHLDTIPSLRKLILAPKYAANHPSHAMSDRSTNEDINIDSSDLIRLLKNHSRTMRFVALDMVCLRGSWLKLLEAFRRLPNSCDLEIFAPSLVSRGEVKSVQFKWQPGEVNKDSMTIYRSKARVWGLGGIQRFTSGFVYRANQDQLHCAIDRMVSSYEVVEKEPYQENP